MRSGVRAPLFVLLLAAYFHAAAVADHSVFSPPLAAYAASDTVQRAQADAAVSCLPTFAAVEERYRALERVFVLDFHSMAQPEGPGSIFRRQLHVLTETVHAERAMFVQRNAPGACASANASHCHFDPSRYLAGESGFSWRWSSRTQRAVSAVMARRGAVESHLYVDFVGNGYVFPEDSVRFSAEQLNFTALLAHPSVVAKPWVTLHFARPPGAADASFLPWGSYEAGEPWEAVLGHGEPRNYSQCYAAAFSSPSRTLQAKLLPHLRRMDAARAAGGAVVGIHLRSLYADFVADMPWIRETLAAAATAAASKQASDDVAGVSGWTQLDCMYPDCEPAMEAANIADAVAARPPIYLRPPVDQALSCGGVARTPLCHYWSAESKVVIDSGGMACGTPGDSAAGLALGEDRRGAVSAAVRCAFAEAEARSTEPSALLLYVAGDLPALHALIAAHPQLRNVSLFAEGAVGHASSNSLCSGGGAGARTCVSGADPSGAWSRTMVDMYMLGACDALVRLGISTFVTGFVNARLAGRTQPQRELAGDPWEPKHIQEQARLLYRLSNAIVDWLAGAQ
jgi:hypothetical protein